MIYGYNSYLFTSLVLVFNISCRCVLASEGYPESYAKNEEISGFDSVQNEAYVFHAGTKKIDGKILSNGGRVLGITALGDSLDSAITNAYAASEKISWPHKYYRKDIGKKGLTYL